MIAKSSDRKKRRKKKRPEPKTSTMRKRERMLQEDEITEAEEAFMEGEEEALGKSRPPLRKRHRDTISVQLAEQTYRED